MAIILVVLKPDISVWVEKSHIGRVFDLIQLIFAGILSYLFTLFLIGIRTQDIKLKTF